jgi:hypothetical protein
VRNNNGAAVLQQALRRDVAGASGGGARGGAQDLAGDARFPPPAPRLGWRSTAAGRCRTRRRPPRRCWWTRRCRRRGRAWLRRQTCCMLLRLCAAAPTRRPGAASRPAWRPARGGAGWQAETLRLSRALCAEPQRRARALRLRLGLAAFSGVALAHTSVGRAGGVSAGGTRLHPSVRDPFAFRARV